MKTDLGIVLLTIENSKAQDIVFDCISKIIDNNPYNQICIFNSTNNRISDNKVPVMHLNQAKFFHGNLIIFDTMSLLFAKNFPNINNILFYASDIFWSNQSYSRYSDIASLFQTNRLEFIVSDQYLFDIYSTCWKKPLGISKDFNYETIKNFI